MPKIPKEPISARKVQKRQYCWTLNNYDAVDCERIAALDEDIRVKRLVVCAEVGASGTPHLQGYIHLANLVTFVGLKKMLGEVHLIACDGSPQENYDYCTKSFKGPHHTTGGKKGVGVQLDDCLPAGFFHEQGDFSDTPGYERCGCEVVWMRQWCGRVHRCIHQDCFYVCDECPHRDYHNGLENPCVIEALEMQHGMPPLM